MAARRKTPETTQPERRQLAGRKPTGSTARGSSVEMRFRASPRMSARLRELAQENGRGLASFVRWQLAQSLKISE